MPVALWREGNFAAVLSIGLDRVHADEDGDYPFSQYIDVLVSTGTGWSSTGGAPGSSWPVPYGSRLAGDVPRFTGFAAGYERATEGTLWLLSGTAPIGSSAVRVAFPDGTQVVEAEPVSGAFLVAARDPSAPVELAGL